MKISELKTGYQFLQTPKFEDKDYTTWAGPFIKFFENIWNKIYKKPICPYTHSFTVVWENGALMVYEAVSPVYRKITFEEKLKEISIDRLLILVPQFQFDENILISEAEKMLGTPYGYVDVFLAEKLYQETDERFWIGSRNAKTVYCNKACSYLKFKATKCKLFNDYYNRVANDQLKSQLYSHEILEK